MAKKIIWTFAARRQFKEIIEYILRDSIQGAVQVQKAILAKVGSLQHFDSRGRLIPECRYDDLREVFSGKYRIAYLVTESTIVVIAIIHGARHLKFRWFQQQLTAVPLEFRRKLVQKRFQSKRRING